MVQYIKHVSFELCNNGLAVYPTLANLAPMSKAL